MTHGRNQSSTKPQRPGGARVPRASLGVSILRDPDYVALMSMGKEGQQAFAAFVSIILAAKDLGNAGQFREPLQVVAAMIRWPADELAEAIARIHSACKCNGHDPWLTVSRRGSRIIVRSFEEWNTPSKGWGGQRIGAGRKKSVFKSDSSSNQDETPPQVGIGDGIGSSSSGGGAGGTTPVTSADTWDMENLFARLKEVVPERRRPGDKKIVRALVEALRDGADGEKIICAATAYYKTKHSRGQYGWGLASFLLDGHYDDDASAWKENRAIDNGADCGETKRSEAARARRRKEDEAVRRERASDPDGFAQAQRGGSQ